MKGPSVLGYGLLACLPMAIAHPGMAASMNDIKKHAKRADGGSGILIGDLATLADSQLTSVAKDIKKILLNNGDARSSVIDQSIPAGNPGTAACKADLCCIWKWISYDMTATFNGTSGRCNRLARGAVRLGFHDAGTWSTASSYGGADGSILLSNEMSRAENNGLQTIASQMQTWYNRYNQYGVSMADLIQFGANVATVVCPLGPRIRSFVGRKDNSKAGPNNMLPGETDSASTLITLFNAKTINPHDLVALVGAHTTSQQHFVNTGRDGDPQDSTPGIWDVAFYGQTTGSPPPRVLKFHSDINLSQDSRTSPEWQEFIGGQDHWNEDYANAYTRLSLLGVNNINSLQECTKVMPPARNSFNSQDQPILDLWLQGQYNQLNDYVDQAIMLTGLT